MGKWRARCGVAAAAAMMVVAPSHGETRALLAGAWKFGSPLIPDLEGPQNDLAAMEALIRGEGATDVTVLRNDGVTRTTFETALHALGLRAKKGDWILIYYSGHGAEADAAIKGTADGDRDQFLPLPGFDLDHEDAEHFIVDKDLYAWIARYIPRGVEVLMMADACHSGTLQRSIDPRAWRFTPRLAFRGFEGEIKLVARPAPRFPSVLAGQTDAPQAAIQRVDLPNEIYIGAAQDDQFALEASMPVEGAPSRGLLTYSFEQALTQTGPDGKTLAADTDHDGKLSVGELSAYLGSQVRALTGQRQETSAHYPTSADRLPLFETVAERPVVASPAAKPLPAVFVSSGGSGDASGWRAAPSPDQADFIWDAKAGTVLRRSGDVVAQHVASIAALNGVVEKWAAIDALRPFLSEAAAKLVIGPGVAGMRHPPGAILQVGLELRPVAGARYATVFNLASDGTVQPLYPLDGDGDGRLSGFQLPVLDTAAVEPYGTDHVVALVTPTPPIAFRQQLRVTSGQRGAGRLVAPMRALLVDAGRQGALSIGEIYTGP